MTKEEEILAYLSENVFNPVLNSDEASESLKKGVRKTIMCLNKLEAKSMVAYYWHSIIGTERSTEFAGRMRDEGFTHFEEVIDDFRDRFNDAWLSS